MSSSSSNRRLRKRTKKFYNDEEHDEIFEHVFHDEQTWKVEDKIRSTENYRADFVLFLTSDEFNFSFLEKNGFSRPIVVKEKRGLGIQVPTDKFNVDHVRTCVGSKRSIDVIDVQTQQSFQMTLKSWADYFNQPSDKRDRLLNVISLEFSHTRLDHYVQPPQIVRQIDWVFNLWPRHWFQLQHEYQQTLKQDHMY